MDAKELLAELSRPFEPKHITWKPGSTTKDGTKCMALAYADLRAYMERLDEVMGLDWSARYTFWGDNRIACELTLYIGDMLGRREGITRSSTGEMDAQDEKNNMGGTVAEAQAFKRAAAMFGLGRFLYDLPSVWVEFDSQRKKISDAGQKDLDKRYSDWYARNAPQTAQKAQEQPKTQAKPSPPPRVVNEDTGEIMDDALHVEMDMSNGDVIFAPEPSGPVATQTRLNLMHMRGKEYYKTQENWDTARPRWVLSATGDKHENTKYLTPEQCEWVIEGLETRIAKRAAANAQEPIATVA